MVTGLDKVNVFHEFSDRDETGMFCSKISVPGLNELPE